jgi:AAA+ superfamily predicted ATPase
MLNAVVNPITQLVRSFLEFSFEDEVAQVVAHMLTKRFSRSTKEIAVDVKQWIAGQKPTALDEVIAVEINLKLNENKVCYYQVSCYLVNDAEKALIRMHYPEQPVDIMRLKPSLRTELTRYNHCLIALKSFTAENDKAASARTSGTAASLTPNAPALMAREARERLENVFVSAAVREQIDLCMAMIREYDLLFNDWELSKIDPRQRGVTLNFFGPPGTGKTKMAEALAHEFGKKIIEVNYASLVSELQGQTGKNIEAIFTSAREENAVLFFDEADSLLSRRAENASRGGDQDLNTAKTIMFKQMDRFDGIIIFATNLFQSYDAAFFRRILAHIEFKLPDQAVRQQLWDSMLSTRVPGRNALDMEALAAYSEGLSGGDMVNVVKKTLGRLLLKTPRILVLDDLQMGIDEIKLARRQHRGIEEEILEGEEKEAALRKLEALRQPSDDDIAPMAA